MSCCRQPRLTLVDGLHGVRAWSSKCVEAMTLRSSRVVTLGGAAAAATTGWAWAFEATAYKRRPSCLHSPPLASDILPPCLNSCARSTVLPLRQCEYNARVTSLKVSSFVFGRERGLIGGFRFTGQVQIFPGFRDFSIWNFKFVRVPILVHLVLGQNVKPDTSLEPIGQL